MSKFEKIIQKNVTISVILTTYNSSKYLKKSVESILNQTYKKFELIIVDDCSTDDTKKKLKRFSSLEKRIKLIFN